MSKPTGTGYVRNRPPNDLSSVTLRDGPSPPDGGWGYAVIVGVFIGFAILGGIARSSPLIYQALYEKFGKSATQTSWVISLSGVSRFMISPLVSVCCNRFGVRTTVIFGTILASGGLVASAWPPSLWITYLTFGVIFGTGVGFVATSSYIILGQYFDKNRGKANGISSMGVGVGAMIIAPLGPISFDHYGYSGTMILLGGLMLHLFISAALFRPLPLSKMYVQEMEVHVETSNGGVNNRDKTKTIGVNVDEDPMEQKTLDCIEETEEEDETEMSQQKTSFCDKYFNVELLRERQFLSFCFLMVGIFMCFGCRHSFMSLHAKEKHIVGREFAFVLLAESVSDLIGRLTSGLLFDIKAIKKRRIILFSIFTLVLSVMMCVLPFSYNFMSFISMIICRAVFLSAVHAQHLTILSDVVGPSRLSSAIGLCRVSMGIAYLIGPPVGGALRDWSGQYRYTYIFTGVIPGFGVFLFLFFNYKHISF